MESDLNRGQDPSFFPFDVLPLEIQSRILGLLPITTLLICKAVSPSWRSLIRSSIFIDFYHPTRDPIFLLFSDQDPICSTIAYLPSVDRWIRFPLPAPFTSCIDSTDPSGVARTLIFSDYDHTERYAIINPFSRDRPLDILPPVIDPDTRHTALALIEDSPSDYTLVVVTYGYGVITTQTYHSKSGRWEPRGHIPIVADSVHNTAVLYQGLLYCLSCYPDHFLTFDLVTGEWSILELDLPVSSLNRHLLSFGGDLYLTAPIIHEPPSLVIGIWKLDQSSMIWREFDSYLCEFILGAWFVVDCMGIISYGDYHSNNVLMCDLGDKRWWYSQCSTIPSDTSPWEWVGQTIEPPIDLLK